MKPILACASLVAVCLSAGIAGGDPLPAGDPEAAGFSIERLGKLHRMVQDHVIQGKHAGAVVAVARDGRIVDFQAYGYRDLAAYAPMQRDTIVRIYSMSKVIASVAVMQLFEEGRFGLDDPAERYIPELKGLKVCAGGTTNAPTLTDTIRPITIRHLLTHTAGFAYDFSAQEPMKSLYRDAALFEASTLKDFIDRLVKLPLCQQPGEGFLYGVNVDVLGYLVQVLSGLPFEVYLRDRVLQPLAMNDTAFDVPKDKLGRLAKVYETAPGGRLREAASTAPGKKRLFPSGGGGLFSTADDYLRFAQMLLNGGELDGHRILGRKTLELMTANHLTFLREPTTDGNHSEGFGLGGMVLVDPVRNGLPASAGLFGWNGAATTTFRIDPREQTTVLLFIQHFPYDEHGIFERFYRMVYSAQVR